MWAGGSRRACERSARAMRGVAVLCLMCEQAVMASYKLLLLLLQWPQCVTLR